MLDATVMALLHERIPLTLLWDLLDPAGPRSAEILALEQAGPLGGEPASARAANAH